MGVCDDECSHGGGMTDLLSEIVFRPHELALWKLALQMNGLL